MNARLALRSQMLVRHPTIKEFKMAKDFELKDNTMSLLKNGFKEEDDNRPDYTGSAKVNGVELKASLWINTTKSGATNLRGQFQPKEGSGSPF